MESEMHRGYIKLYRKIQDNCLWKEPRKFSKAEAWIDILLSVNHKDAQVLIGGNLMECKRGESLQSLETWQRRWRWGSKGAVRRFFTLLENAGQICVKNETRTVRLTVCNYDTYNEPRNENGTQTERRRNADGTQTESNKNEENAENEKKHNRGVFQKPTMAEVQEYVSTRPVKIDADTFWNFYESKGWMVGKSKMKDWKAAVHTWEKNRGTQQQAQPFTMKVFDK